jgi:hypothetical protein
VPFFTAILSVYFFSFCVCWLTCTFLQQKAKAYSLMQTLASGLNGLLSNFIQGLTKSFVEEGRFEDSEDNVVESNEDENSEYSSSSDEEEVIPPATLLGKLIPNQAFH